MKIGLMNEIEIGEVKKVFPNQLEKGKLYYFTDYTGKYDEYWREIIGIFTSVKYNERSSVYFNKNIYNFKVIYCSKFASEEYGYKQLKVGSITRQSPKDLRLNNLCEVLDLENEFIKKCLVELQNG